MLKLKLQYCSQLIQRANSLEKTLRLGKTEGRRRRGQQRLRLLDGITYSVDMILSQLQGREAWRAVVHGVAKSRTRLSDWTDLNWTPTLMVNLLIFFPAIMSVGCFTYLKGFSCLRCHLEFSRNWSILSKLLNVCALNYSVSSHHPLNVWGIPLSLQILVICLFFCFFSFLGVSVIDLFKEWAFEFSAFLNCFPIFYFTDLVPYLYSFLYFFGFL